MLENYFDSDNNVISHKMKIPTTYYITTPIILNGSIPSNVNISDYVKGDYINGYRISMDIPRDKAFTIPNRASNEPWRDGFVCVFMRGVIDDYYVAMFAPWKRDSAGNWIFRLYSFNDVTWLRLLKHYSKELEVFGFTRDTMMNDVIKLHCILQKCLNANKHQFYEYNKIIVDEIDKLCIPYLKLSEEIYQQMTLTYYFLYFSMISEEFKDMSNGKYVQTDTPTFLGSLVKVDGALLCLMYDYDPEDAANHLSGKGKGFEALKRMAYFGIYRNDWHRGTTENPKGFGSDDIFDSEKFSRAVKCISCKKTCDVAENIVCDIVGVDDSNKHEDI